MNGTQSTSAPASPTIRSHAQKTTLLVPQSRELPDLQKQRSLNRLPRYPTSPTLHVAVTPPSEPPRVLWEPPGPSTLGLLSPLSSSKLSTPPSCRRISKPSPLPIPPSSAAPAKHPILPPLPSPTFSEMFYLESGTPRPTPHILITPAEGPAKIFWANDKVVDEDEGSIDENKHEDKGKIDPKEVWSITEKANGTRSYTQIAVAAHIPGVSDEIPVSVGDKLEVYKRFKDGWIHGRNCTTNKVGIFPGGCLTLLTPPGGLPHFMTSASRQDSALSVISFISNASNYLYDDPPTPSPKPSRSRSRSRSRERAQNVISSAASASSATLQPEHTVVQVEKKYVRRLRPYRRTLWEKARKPLLILVLMAAAISLVLGLGLGLGKVNPAQEPRATELAEPPGAESLGQKRQ